MNCTSADGTSIAITGQAAARPWCWWTGLCPTVPWAPTAAWPPNWPTATPYWPTTGEGGGESGDTPPYWRLLVVTANIARSRLCRW